ncbi:MAG: TIM barrel protein [Thermoguttaceae bacterium]
MKLGLDSYSTRNSGLDPAGVLGLAHELGLQGVLFELSPFASFRDRDLDAVRSRAAELGLYVELGMGSIFRWHPMAEKGRTLLSDAGYDVSLSEARIVIHHLKIAQRLGAPLLRCVAGNLFTRDEGHDMPRLADQAVDILREACRAAGDMGLRIAMENHADFTVRELAGIWGRVDSPAFGFTLDCANLAFDLDDPLRLARMMAPHALTTHFKNYRVIRTPRGLALENCSLGDGEIDLPAIAEILAAEHPRMNLNIEIHTQFAPFALEILDKTYFQRHPAPPGDGLAWYLQAAWNKQIASALPGNLPDGELSWQREHDDLRQSARWAQQKLAHLFSA